VRTNQDVININNCPAFIGNLFIISDEMSGIVLNGTITISGELRASAADGSDKLELLASPTLRSVSALAVEGLPRLTTLSFPAITKLSDLRLVALRKLEECTVSNGSVIEGVQSIMLVDTALKSLHWLTWPVSRTLNVQSNPKLASLTIPGPAVGNNSSYYIYSNDALADLNAPRLDRIDGLLAISGGPLLNQLHFHQLKALTGAIRFDGQFDNITMPAMTVYDGQLDVNSTRNIEDFCQEFASHGNDYQTMICTSYWTDEPTPWAKALANETANVPTSRVTKSNSSQTLVAVLTLLGAFLFALCLLLYICRRWSCSKKARISNEELSNNEKRHSSGSLKELWCPEEILELPNGKEMQELPDQCTQESGGESIYELGMNECHSEEKSESPAGPLDG
jgi:hypothetical protein